MSTVNATLAMLADGRPIVVHMNRPTRKQQATDRPRRGRWPWPWRHKKGGAR